MPDLHQRSEHAFRLATRAAFATYRSSTFVGEYQGYGASVAYQHRWVYAEAALAGYRIVRNGLKGRGLGDLAVDVRGTVWQSEQLAAGLELAATLPTGNADLGLGMGHVMLMPGAFISYREGGLNLMAQLTYGRALASSSHAHHGATGPLVNPMNRSEVEHALTLSYALSEQLFVGSRLVGAVPVAAAEGKAREVVAFGLGASWGPMVIDLELQLPLVGAPFDTRSVLTASALF